MATNGANLKNCIAGWGAVSALGSSAAKQWEALLAGRLGVRKEAVTGGYPCPVGRIITPLPNSDSPSYKWTRTEQLSLIAMEEAIVGLKAWSWSDPGLGFLFCSAKGNVSALLGAPGPYATANLAQRIADHYGMLRPAQVISTACSSGLTALVMAHRQLITGQRSRVIIVGCDVVSSFTLRGFQTLKAISPEICRPYDANRSGTNLGEGAAAIVLERRLPEPGDIILAGGATSNDASHISRPSQDGTGLSNCINRSLNGAHPDFICGHGTATRLNDEMEAAAFSRSGIEQVPIFGVKAQLGHTLGACGVLETIIAGQCLQENTLPPSLQFEHTGTTTKLNINQRLRHQPLTSCLKTAAGFGGSNAAIFLQKQPPS